MSSVQDQKDNSNYMTSRNSNACLFSYVVYQRYIHSIDLYDFIILCLWMTG